MSYFRRGKIPFAQEIGEYFHQYLDGRSNLAFLFTTCYTRLESRGDYPYARVVAELDELRCQQRKDIY